MGVFNRCAFFLTLLKDRASKGRTPLVVVLNISFRCNLRCGYCYGQYFSRKEKDFSTGELLALIESLSKLGTRSITLGGGEPLIRDDIGIIINKVKEHGIECGMNTNGTLIPGRIEELRAIDMVTVSIDGPKENNDANRGDGSYEKIMAGIDKALEAGIRIHTTTVITRYNYNAVDSIVKMAEEKGMQAEFNFLFNQSEDKDYSDKFMAENDSLRKAVKRIVELKKQGAPILFSEEVYQYIANWPDYRKRIIMGRDPSFDFIPCYAGRFMMFIDADGRVYPCVQLIGIFDGLDFRKVGIKKAWDNCALHSCKACYFPCFNEFSAVMDLNFGVIRKQIFNTLKRH